MRGRTGAVAALAAALASAGVLAAMGAGRAAGDGRLRGALAAHRAPAAASGALSRSRLLALHAEPDRPRGGRVVDAAGREVLLRGVNVNALGEYGRAAPQDPTFPLDPGDPARVAGFGWNVVRLVVSWSAVEPRPGDYDERYLDRVAGAVRRFAAVGVYTIVDLHQDAWGAATAAPAGLSCPAGAIPAVGFDGAPAWATVTGGRSRCSPSAIREATPAVLAAWAAFWRDAPGAGDPAGRAQGIGLQRRYAAMLRHVASRFATEPAVAGFDLMNEPSAIGEAELTALSRFYGTAFAAVRAGERDGVRMNGRSAVRHLVLVEPPVLWNVLGKGAPAPFPHDRDLVYAPHLYGSPDAGGATGNLFAVARREAAATFGGAPVLVGEWGADPTRPDRGDTFFVRHQQAQDRYRTGAALWQWRESCGDPHKVLEARRDGRPGVLWSPFAVACPANQVVGERAALAAQLRRGYVRAVPGVLGTTTWEGPTGTLTATGLAPAPVSPPPASDRPATAASLVAWLPAAPAVVSSTGLGPVAVRRSPGGGVLLTAVPAGGPWRLTATPPRDS